MEFGGRFGIIVLFGVVVDGIDFGNSPFQCPEVLVEHRGYTCSVSVYEVFDVAVRAISPSADADFDVCDAGGLCFEVGDVFLIVWVLCVKHVLSVVADGVAVGCECAVFFDIDVEQDGVSEARIA